MRTLAKEEFEKEKVKLVRELRKCVFIHPTDTVYGIGCNATDRKLVRKLRSAKEQFSRPLSVIAPSMEWIRENCKVGKEHEEWLDKLPGPYTLILELENREAVSDNTNLGKETLGVRRPDHWIVEVVNQMKVPIITTSANVTGGKIMNEIEDLDKQIKDACEYALYEGRKEGTASKIIDLTKEEPEVLRD